MEETLMEQSNPATMGPMPTAPKPRGRKAGKRKSGFRMDTPPFPIRAIWELATEQERQEAHQTGVLILEHWLGRMTRKDLGTKLNLPPLRVWQLSQQALAGMVVGLMAQPKRPPKGTPMAQTHQQDKDELKALRKKTASLEQENRVLKELLDLLKDMPGQAAASPTKGKKMGSAKPGNPLRESRTLAAESKPKEG